MSFYLIAIKKETLEILFFKKEICLKKASFYLITIKKETLEIRFF